MEGKEVPIFGDGSLERDYTYIDDIVDGILRALDATGNSTFSTSATPTPSALTKWWTPWDAPWENPYGGSLLPPPPAKCFLPMLTSPKPAMCSATLQK